MTILITGGSSGIGRAIAEECAKNGHHLVLVARNFSRLQRTRKQIVNLTKAKIDIISANVAVPNQVKNARAYCQKHSCVPDVLIMNAGIFLSGKISKASPSDIQKIMATNVYSVFFFVHEFVPLLKKRRQAKVIIIGSTAGIEPHKSATYGSLYSTTKWAIRGLASNLRQELMKDGIGVTHIAPGSVMTEMWGRSGKPKKMLKSQDIGKLVAAILTLSPQAVVEEIVVRPIFGNI